MQKFYIHFFWYIFLQQDRFAQNLNRTKRCFQFMGYIRYKLLAGRFYLFQLIRHLITCNSKVNDLIMDFVIYLDPLFKVPFRHLLNDPNQIFNRFCKDLGNSHHDRNNYDQNSSQNKIGRTADITNRIVYILHIINNQNDPCSAVCRPGNRSGCIYSAVFLFSCCILILQCLYYLWQQEGFPCIFISRIIYNYAGRVQNHNTIIFALAGLQHHFFQIRSAGLFKKKSGRSQLSGNHICLAQQFLSSFFYKVSLYRMKQRACQKEQRQYSGHGVSPQKEPAQRNERDLFLFFLFS